MKYHLALCRTAVKHHQLSKRAFAHIFHKPNTICVAPEFVDLPETYQAGILLHELGHAASSAGDEPYSHSEHDADRAAFEISGIVIRRRTYRGAKNLEVIASEDLAPASRFLHDMIDMHLKGVK